MNSYKKEFTFKIADKSTFKEKLQYYFNFYGFNILENKEDEFVYFKKSSFFDGWKFNPINWGSKVKITEENNVLKISYLNEGNAQVTPFAFHNLFKTFFKNLELYLNNSINFEEKNSMAIKKAKQKFLSFFIIIIASLIVCILLGKFVSQKFNIQYLDTFSLIVGALLIPRIINNYWIHKIA